MAYFCVITGAHIYVKDGGFTYNGMAMKTSYITVILRLTVKCHMPHVCTLNLINITLEVIFISMIFDYCLIHTFLGGYR